MDQFKFRVVYEMDGAQAVYLSIAETEEKAKKEFKNWVRETFPFTPRVRILYCTPYAS